MFNRFAISGVLLLLAATLFTACVSRKQARQQNNLAFTADYCSPTIPYVLTAPKEDSTASVLSLPLSQHDRLICAALGISRQVDSLARLQGEPAQIPVRLQLREKIITKILTAQSQIQSVAAELDCEGERANLAAGYLDRSNGKRNNRLTAASVGLGALTTVAAIVVSGKGAQTATGIGGGVLSAGLAALTINPEGKHIHFTHRRNLLRSIWFNAPVNTDYPYFVWRMLHEKQFSNKGDITLAASIRNRWLQFNFNGNISAEDEALFFGAGGDYHAEQLHTRSALINQLQATIRSLNQDLTGTIALIQRL